MLHVQYTQKKVTAIKKSDPTYTVFGFVYFEFRTVLPG
jgi:hypothetical protein